MIESSAPQGTAEWDREHLGALTSRHIGRVITNGWKASGAETVEKLLRELTAEYISGQEYAPWEGNKWTERGERLEPDALMYYCALHDNAATRKGGVVWTDERRLAGSSPDMMVGDHGVGEVKCPGLPRHIANVLEVRRSGNAPRDHLRQCQWHLWVTKLDWCDFMSYTDETCVRTGKPLPQALVRVYPLAAAFNAFDRIIPKVIAQLEAMREEMTGLIEH